MNSSILLSETIENVQHFYLFLFHRLVTMESACTYAVVDQVSNRKYLPKLIKRRSKVYQTNISRKRGSNLGQLFSENY